jgi:triacylglycerol lipase
MQDDKIKSSSMKSLVVPCSPKFADNALSPVVLVHGIFRNHHVMRPLLHTLESAGRKVLAPDLRPADGSAGILELAGQLADYVHDHLGPDERCDLIGHSMGGLVARTYVQRCGGDVRVRRLITLAAPHHGTQTAWFWPGRGVRDMRPGSPFLRNLAGDVARLERVRVVSVWTPYDMIIVPPQSSALPVGENVCMRLAHHRAFLSSRRLAKRIEGWIAEESRQ